MSSSWQGDEEIPDSPVFLAEFHDFFGQLVDFFVHLLRDVPHMAAFLGEEIRLVFPVFYILFQSGVLHPFALQPGLDVLHYFEIIAGVLLNLLREDIEIKHAVGERVQEIGIMGNDDTSFFCNQ